MKKPVFLSVIISLIIASCSRQEVKSPIEGAWQLISIKNMSGDTLIREFPKTFTGSDIIIFSKSHLLSVGRFKQDTIFIDNYVGAKYTLDGNHFEETLLYFPINERVGQIVKQILELKNDTLIKTYPCDDSWEIVKSDYYIEKFVRLEQ
jgi:hypothetical protein